MYRVNAMKHFLPSLGIRSKFTLDPNDLVIQNVIGSGPGGTKVASTRNKVVVKHIPTNIVVKCHQTRFLDQNKRIAIEQLTNKVELYLYGEDSSVAIKKAKKLEGYEERKQARKDESDRRMEANRLKREVANAAKKKEFDNIMTSGLPYLRNNLNRSPTEKGEEKQELEESESERKAHNIASPDTEIFRDKSQSQDSLKSMFGAPNKKK